MTPHLNSWENLHPTEGLRKTGERGKKDTNRVFLGTGRPGALVLRYFVEKGAKDWRKKA